MELGNLVELPMASSYRGSLAKGCEECKEGRKMVLFVSGLCRFRCFYCPVSPNRNQRDVTYANERLIHSDAEIFEEARAMGATGTGITGGDPLGVIDRTEHYVRLLRGEFGPEHHMHLYTHEPNPEKLQRLAKAGLDEVRLHIPHYLWGTLSGQGAAYRKVLEDAPSWGLRRGVEIPVLPEKEAELRRLLTTLSDMGVEFVNLNELEYSETNAENLDARGYKVAPGTGWGVDGSKAVAERIVRELRLPMPIHYCSSRFKDGVQLRQRLLRRAERTGPPYAEFTDEGTLVYGIVEVPEGRDLAAAARRIARVARVRQPAYRVDEGRRRVELASADLRRVADGLAFPAFEVEVYPTADALEVEREPLNRAAFPRTVGGV
jgi:pyruvate formate-lyase activating enzyme-like uncharacterized protein